MLEDKISAWQLFLAGGPVMWPILLISIFATAIIIEKFLYLKKIKLDARQLLDRILEKIKHGKIKEALQITDSCDSPVARVLKAGILKYDRTREQIKEAVSDAAMCEIPEMEKNLPILATIAHIGPLLGLSGTVLGLMKIFHAMHLRSVSSYPVYMADLSFGVWEALICTIFGLIVAIPAFTAYNYLLSRINRLIAQIEMVSGELVNFLVE
jgi:biopolymer transport protein ExbB